MSVGYNEQHVQVAPTGASPTWLDVGGTQSWEPSVSADATQVKGDGTTYVTLYAAPEGTGDLTFLNAALPVFAVLNGGTVSSTGSDPNTIESWSITGNYVPPAFQIADWVPNADLVHDADVAGMRITVKAATAGPVSRSSGQESEQVWTASTSFVADANNVMILFEKLQTAPTFTSGVMAIT